MFPIEVDTITSGFLDERHDNIGKLLHLIRSNGLRKIRPSTDCPDEVLTLFLAECYGSINGFFLPVIIILPSWVSGLHDLQDISLGHGLVDSLTVPLLFVRVIRIGSVVQSYERIVHIRVDGWDIVRLVPVLQVCGQKLLVFSIGARFGCHSSDKHIQQ